jgi:hypothetical protein
MSARFGAGVRIEGLLPPLCFRSTFRSRLHARGRLAVPPGRHVVGAAPTTGARSRTAAAPSFTGLLHQPGAGIAAGTERCRCWCSISFLTLLRGALKKSHATIPWAWALRNSLHDGPPRRGAGPRPPRLTIILIVVAPTQMPSLRNSPWMRRQPHLGFSLARRKTSSRISGSIGGRPGERRRYVHFFATSSRCQRSSVCGLTRNTDQRSLGNKLLAAASNTRSLRCIGGRFTARLSTASW